jgi:adenosylcobinamide-phosphate synthase
MRLELQILTAFALDLLFGDPRWLPHPVKIIGRFALAIERPIRKLIPMARAAGALAVCIIVGLTGLISWILIRGAGALHLYAGDALSILLLYTAFASRDLMRHSNGVYASLKKRDIKEARRRVAMLVGRDVDRLDEPEIARAAVESVAENLVDGVTAPILFAVLGGPVGAMMYKAVSTLDSTFGYKDENYLLFGWASARLDDVANYLPARLTVPFMAVAAAILGFQPVQSLRICFRDGRKHDSPNSGLSEAAMAGALGIQLGGLNYYGGEAHEGPRMGNPGRTLGFKDILSANQLMFVTSILCLLIWTGARALIYISL